MFVNIILREELNWWLNEIYVWSIFIKIFYENLMGEISFKLLILKMVFIREYYVREFGYFEWLYFVVFWGDIYIVE